MKFHSHLNVAARPDIRLRMRTQRLPIDLVCEGTAELATGPMEIEFGEIPIAVRVPFHNRRVVAATIGAFRLRVTSVAAELRSAGLRVSGAIGAEGDSVEAHIVGNCAAEMDVAGHATGLRIDVEEGPDGS